LLPRHPIDFPGFAVPGLRRAGVCDACIERYEATATELAERAGWCGAFTIRLQCCSNACGQALRQFYDDWQKRLDERFERLSAEMKIAKSRV
jgi:hypothetical protein